MSKISEISTILKISKSSNLKQFLNECIDEFVGVKNANFENYDSDIEWSDQDFDKVNREIQKLYRRNIEEDDPDWSSLEELPSNVAEEIKWCYNRRENEMYEHTVKEKIKKTGHNLVENFDWRLKWILGSSKLNTLHEVLLQVDLNCIKNNENGQSVPNIVRFELDIEKLDSFIDQLKEAKNALENTLQ